MRSSIGRPFILSTLTAALLLAGCARYAVPTPAPLLQRPTSVALEPGAATARPTSRATPTPARVTQTPPPTQPAPFPPTPYPSPSTTSSVESAALVEAIQVNVAESQPVQMSVTVKGHLPDGCTRIVGSTIEFKEPVIALTVRTARPPEAMCTLALVPFEETFPLDVRRLGPGSYIVEVHGLRQPLELTAAMLLLPGAQTFCIPAGEGMRAYTSLTNRFCLLHPAAYYVFRPEPNLVVISARLRSNLPRALVAQLEILRQGPAQGRSAEQWAKERLAEVIAQGAALSWGTFTLGGETGVLVDGAPQGEFVTRQGYVMHADTLYILTLSPFQADEPESLEEALALWDAVVASFVFLD